MATVDDLADLWFRHPCTLISGAGESPYGEPLGTRIPVFGYVRQVTRTVVSVSGQERITDTTVRLPLVISDAEGKPVLDEDGQPVRVVEGDHVELPEPFNGRWEVDQIALLHGAGNPTPDHQKLTLKAAIL
ncbi:MAG: hypothetical protein L0J68_13290 [Micrococcaceae bacterium]|nr:hypothetical protein [Micrococcaceae bacterium]